MALSCLEVHLSQNGSLHQTTKKSKSEFPARTRLAPLRTVGFALQRWRKKSESQKPARRFGNRPFFSFLSLYFKTLVATMNHPATSTVFWISCIAVGIFCSSYATGQFIQVAELDMFSSPPPSINASYYENAGAPSYGDDIIGGTRFIGLSTTSSYSYVSTIPGSLPFRIEEDATSLGAEVVFVYDSSDYYGYDKIEVPGLYGVDLTAGNAQGFMLTMSCKDCALNLEIIIEISAGNTNKYTCKASQQAGTSAIVESYFPFSMFKGTNCSFDGVDGIRLQVSEGSNFDSHFKKQ
jgi:hypothetical protein